MWLKRSCSIKQKNANPVRGATFLEKMATIPQIMLALLTQLPQKQHSFLMDAWQGTLPRTSDVQCMNLRVPDPGFQLFDLWLVRLNQID